MSVNVPVLESVMAHIKGHPERHYQGAWIRHIETTEESEGMASFNEGVAPACGTAACFAGWVGILHAEQYGYLPVTEDERWCEAEFYYREGTRPDPNPEYNIHVSEVAREILGLTSNQADTIFAGGNTRAMLELMVKDLANGEELAPSHQYWDRAGRENKTKLSFTSGW